MKDPAHTSELEFIKDWTLTIFDVIDKFYLEDKQDDFREIVINAFNNHNLRGMRYIFNDSCEMAYAMRKQHIDFLNTILMTRFGFNLNDKNKKDLVKIKAILSRGCIKMRVNIGCFRIAWSRYTPTKIKSMNWRHSIVCFSILIPSMSLSMIEMGAVCGIESRGCRS